MESPVPHAVVLSRPAAVPLRSIVATALFVALIDGLYVVAAFDWIMGVTTATRLFQGIALALVGRDTALGGGTAMVMLGMATHVAIALAWTTAWALLVMLVPRLRELATSLPAAIFLGIAWGIVIHLAMQLALLPMTQAAVAPLASRGSLIVLLAHVTVIGPPIVLLLRSRRLTGRE